MKRKHMVASIGVSLILIGFSILLVAYYVRTTNAAIQTQPIVNEIVNNQPQIIETPTAIQGKPIELSITDLDIKNEVIDGVFSKQTGQWTLTRDKVQYATMTYQPNNLHGVTFMYGHNRKEVFSRLPRIQIGSIAVVKTDSSHTFYYRFVSSKVTKPEDISIFEYNGPPILVLQTCTGLFFENRQLFTFEFTGVDNG
ncbi:sortase [Pedobacter sp.]|nr:sortase [Candidatus Saccharibacteria bacterium]